MRTFKGTVVGKSSDLAKALDVSPEAANKVFKETQARYEALYSAEDRAWFAAWGKTPAPTVSAT